MAQKRHGRRHQSGESLMAKFSDMKAQYRAASAANDRFVSANLGAAAIGVGANVHTVNDASYFKIMELARWYEINDRLVGVALRRLVTNCLQQGMTVNPSTGDKEVNKLIKDKFSKWADDKKACDITQRWTLNQQAKMVLRRIVIDGDLFVLPTKSGQLQYAEGHRCRTPRNMMKRSKLVVPIHGVEQNENTAAVEKYWFTKTDTDLLQTVHRVDEVTSRKADDVLHLYLPERFTQSRGVSALARVPTEPGQYDDAVFARLVASQVQSCFAVIEEMAFDPENGLRSPNLGDDLGDKTETTVGDWQRVEHELQPGMILPGKPGATYKPFVPNINSNDFAVMSKMILGTLAVNLDVPLVVLLLDASETNFSGFRGAVDQARMRYKELQQELIDQFYTPVYLWKLNNWLRTDPDIKQLAKRTDINVRSHTWNRPRFSYLEPLKDTTADSMKLSRCMISPIEFQGNNGRDWADFYKETVDAYGDAIEEAAQRAADINAKFGTGTVHWRDLLPLPVADGLKVNVNADSDATSNSNEPDETDPNSER